MIHYISLKFKKSSPQNSQKFCCGVVTLTPGTWRLQIAKILLGVIPKRGELRERGDSLSSPRTIFGCMLIRYCNKTVRSLTRVVCWNLTLAWYGSSKKTISIFWEHVGNKISAPKGFHHKEKETVGRFLPKTFTIELEWIYGPLC